MKFKGLILSLVMLGLPAIASAHVYWIQPNEFFFYSDTKEMDKKVSELLSFEFTGGDTYFHADVNRIPTGTYDLTITSPKREHVKPLNRFSGKSRELVEAEINESGTYILSLSRTGAAMYYTKMKDGEYIPKAADELSDEEKTQAVSSTGYYQHAKTYVTYHKASDSWEKPLDHPLEIVPLSHPNLVFAGDTLKVKVLMNGKPLADKSVKFYHHHFRMKKHGDIYKEVKTDDDGVASITFPEANRYLIAVSHDVDVTKPNKGASDNHRASLMLSVEEPWVKDTFINHD